MSLIGDSSASEFSFEGVGDFNFGDLVEGVETSSTNLKMQGITKTEVFAHQSKIDSEKNSPTNFYDAKTFAKLNKNEIPDKERVLAGILIEKEGAKPVLMTRNGEAAQLDQRSIRIHREMDDGTENISDFGSRDITIGKLTDAQYRRIHSQAITNLAVIARQQKEIDDEKKTGAKLKQLVSQKNFTLGCKGDQTVVANKIFQGQLNALSKNRQELNRRMEVVFEQERISEERKTKALDQKRDDRDQMVKEQESKREIIQQSKFKVND